MLEMRHHHDPILRLIALFKLVKAAGLIIVAVGALSPHGGWFGPWIHALTADPHGTYVDRLLARIGSLDPHELREIGVGSLAYAAVFVVEGIGLLLRRTWAEVLTVLVTTSFIPLEVYQLARHPSWMKICVLVVNAAVVVYLLWRLRRDGQGPWRRPWRRVTKASTALP
jgi:uncharacterized membrane protein (DUF2068 family)